MVKNFLLSHILFQINFAQTHLDFDFEKNAQKNS